jgi:type I restriction enzyme R subunit
MKFTESHLEQAFISLLEAQGYPHVHGEEICPRAEEKFYFHKVKFQIKN